MKISIFGVCECACVCTITCLRMVSFLRFLIYSFLSPFISTPKTLQKKKYEKLGYNTKKGGDRDMM